MKHCIAVNLKAECQLERIVLHTLLGWWLREYYIQLIGITLPSARIFDMGMRFGGRGKVSTTCFIYKVMFDEELYLAGCCLENFREFGFEFCRM
jgi:hypothetical protein